MAVWGTQAQIVAQVRRNLDEDTAEHWKDSQLEGYVHQGVISLFRALTPIDDAHWRTRTQQTLTAKTTIDIEADWSITDLFAVRRLRPTSATALSAPSDKILPHYRVLEEGGTTTIRLEESTTGGVEMEYVRLPEDRTGTQSQYPDCPAIYADYLVAYATAEALQQDDAMDMAQPWVAQLRQIEQGLGQVSDSPPRPMLGNTGTT